MNSLWEIERRYEQRRQKYLWTIGFLVGVVIGFFVVTIIIGVKLKNKNNEDKDTHLCYNGAKVEYNIWTHEDPNHPNANHHFKSLTVPQNATMYTVMEHAAHEDHFRFSIAYLQMLEDENDPNSTVFGRYVDSIQGIDDDRDNGVHWILYEIKGDGVVDKNNPPTPDMMAPVGIDDLRVKDGDRFLFWYSKPEYNKDTESIFSKKGFKRLGPQLRSSQE